MTMSLKSNLRNSLESNKLQKRLEAADAANGRIPRQPSAKATVCVSFSLLPTEASLIADLQARAAREGRVAMKSGIVRAAILLLSSLDGKELAAALDQVERVKPGRRRETE